MRSCTPAWRAGLSLGLWLCAWGAPAQPLPVFTTRVQVQARAGAPELVCETPARRAPPAAPQADPPLPPDEAQVQAQLAAEPQPDAVAATAPPPGRWLAPRAGQPLRVAIWGDSHQAAGFFAAELARQLQLEPAQVQAGLLPASMGRAGVRLPLRKVCAEGGWRHEAAHTDAGVAARSGPAMVSMVGASPDASLAWDLRSPEGLAQRPRVQLLYQQTAEPLQLALRVDGGEARVLTLQGPPGPAVLDIEGDASLSTLRLQLLQGQWRWHALRWPVSEGTRLQLDVLGYPGATVAGWQQADSAYQSAWWDSLEPDLVVLAFGTNEGNVQPFDAEAYARSLRAAVAVWRTRFAQAACVLIGPGDRGVLVRRGAKSAGNKAGKGHKRPPAARVDLLRYTRIHAEINRQQQQVAAEHGCRFWSMQQAMGGAGSAYRWQARQPAWMARDLIHFTVAGYQQLARQFASDMGWGPSLLTTAGDRGP